MATNRPVPEARAAPVRAALAEGRVFAAYDLARRGLEAAPDDDVLRLLAGLALVRSGAIEAARAEIGQATVAGVPASDPALLSEAGLLLAEGLEEIWRAGHQKTDLERALAIRLQRSGGPSHPAADTARAALLAFEAGDPARMATLARTALEHAPEVGRGDPDLAADLAELALLLGKRDAAAKRLEDLATLFADRPMERVLVRKRLDALTARGIEIAPELLAPFVPPNLLIFAGTAPPEDRGAHEAFEQGTRAAIDAALDELRPAIAYGSAAAGCDLLFVEALLARGAEVNLVLPFEREDFRRRVAPHGPRWIERFDRALATVATVTEVCHESYLGNDLVLRFGNQVIDGKARLRGATLMSPPYLLVVWDYLAPPSPGSPSDFIDHWGDPGRLRLIDIDDAFPDGVSPAGAVAVEKADVPADLGQQRIATMLFADVVGYSRLTDRELPLFWRFMGAVDAQMVSRGRAPVMTDSWGDAVLAVHDEALDAADYATALNEAFAALDSRHFGLRERLRLRTGLHAGPVFEGDHPLTGQSIIYGGNVNRAARIEPITIPEHIYASEQFVAMITAEESVAEAEARLSGRVHRPRYRCRYRGVLELAKGYGTQSVYEVEPWRPDAAGLFEIEPGQRLHIVLANDLTEHRRLADAFADFAAPLALSVTISSQLEIAFDEILTNICRYAWDDDGWHPIDIEIHGEGDRIRATFSDDGAPFDPLALAVPSLDTDLNERRVGGLGIHLVRELMDEVSYCRDEPFNRLTIVRRIEDEVATQESREAPDE